MPKKKHQTSELDNILKVLQSAVICMRELRDMHMITAWKAKRRMYQEGVGQSHRHAAEKILHSSVLSARDTNHKLVRFRRERDRILGRAYDAGEF